MITQDATQVIEAYFQDHDPRYFAQDAEFRFPDSTQRGRAAIGSYLDYFRHVLFTEVENPVTNLVAAGDRVAAEFTFKGRHSGPLMGIEATGRRVEVPMCAFYDLRAGEISRARLYYDSGTLLAQLNHTEAR